MRTRSAQLVNRLHGLAERESLLVVVVGAYTCGLLARLPDQLRQDGWLALVGGRFVAHAGLPSTDSLTAWSAGTRWVDQQWLGQLLFFRLFELGNLRLVMLTHVVLLGAALATAMAAARWRGGSARSVALVTTLALMTIILSAQLRTQSFAYLLFVSVVWLLIADTRSPSRRVLLVLPLLIVWANLHGSVILAAGLVALRGVFLLRRRQRFLGSLLTFAPAVCLFASPYGLSLAGYYRATILNPSFSRIVTEWQRSTPSFMTAAFYVLAFVGMWLVGRHGGRITRFEKVALLVTAVGGMLALRNMIWFCLLAVIVLPTPLSETVAPYSAHERPRFKSAMAIAACVALIGATVAVAAQPESWYTRKAYPEAAARAVATAAEHQPSAHVFADIRYADWLLWERPRLAGRVVYDARLELLGRGRLDQLYRWTNRASNAALAGSQVLVLDPRDEPSGLDELYQGKRVAVLVRPQLWRSMNARTRPHASSDASANSSCFRSKKLCGAPS